MPHRRAENSDGVDFVVGPAGDDSADEVLDTGPVRRTDKRLLAGLLLAALAVAGVIIALRANPTHSTAAAADRVSATAPARTAPVVPVLPTFPSAPASTEKFTLVDLGPGLCAPHRHCFGVATAPRVRAKIRAAIRQAFGGVGRLRIRNSAVAVDDPPRRLLFAREIHATTPHGRIHLIAAAVDPRTIIAISYAGNTVTTLAREAGYAVAGSVTTPAGTEPIRFFPRITRLASDARVTARS